MPAGSLLSELQSSILAISPLPDNLHLDMAWRSFNITMISVTCHMLVLLMTFC